MKFNSNNILLLLLGLFFFNILFYNIFFINSPRYIEGLPDSSDKKYISREFIIQQT